VLVLKLEWIQTVRGESGMYLDLTRLYAEFKLLPENLNIQMNKIIFMAYLISLPVAYFRQQRMIR